ncbi:MAG TPA: phosphoesterase [Gemmataceae bacterium]|nr:phosphoesterase [Gemmataceae bacterium]
MAKLAERVLVMPTSVFHEAGLFQGFCSDIKRYLPRILDRSHLSYRPRSEVEDDPGFKQIIPYVVLRFGNQVFHYTRGKAGTETRLQALRSLGVGGHISETDTDLFEEPYRVGMLREVSEELELETDYEERCIGLINDDSTPVGQVHLGIVHIFDLTAPHVRRREQALTRSGFVAISELASQRDQYETWSQFLIDGNCLG